jgi:hypothetical protein
LIAHEPLFRNALQEEAAEREGRAARVPPSQETDGVRTLQGRK